MTGICRAQAAAAVRPGCSATIRSKSSDDNARGSSPKLRLARGQSRATERLRPKPSKGGRVLMLPAATSAAEVQQNPAKANKRMAAISPSQVTSLAQADEAATAGS